MMNKRNSEWSPLSLGIMVLRRLGEPLLGGETATSRGWHLSPISLSTLNLLLAPPEDQAGKPRARQRGGKRAGRGETAVKGVGGRRVENNQHT